jgi:hypothetical protein
VGRAERSYRNGWEPFDYMKGSGFYKPARENMRKKLLNLGKTVFNFCYENWFILPMALCFYGITAGYRTMETLLYINFILWFLVGVIVQKEIKNKDQLIRDENQKNDKLCSIIEEK